MMINPQPKPPPPPPPGGLGVLVGSQPQPEITAWEMFNSDRDKDLQDLYNAQNVSINLEEDFERAKQEDARRMAQDSLPIQRIAQYLYGSMLPFRAQQLIKNVRQTLSSTENQRLDTALEKRFSAPSSSSSSSFPVGLEITMTPQKKKHAQ